MPLPPPPAAGLINSGTPTARARTHLVAHEFDRIGGGADEDQARISHLTGEVRILGEETIAGMDRTSTACARRSDDLRAVEIGRDRCRAGDLDRAIGGVNSRRTRIGGVMHHDRFQSQRLHGAQNAQRDLAAIGNQNALERPAAARIGTNVCHYDFAFAEFGQSPFKKISVMVRAIRCTSSGRLPMVWRQAECSMAPNIMSRTTRGSMACGISPFATASSTILMRIDV